MHPENNIPQDSLIKIAMIHHIELQNLAVESLRQALSNVSKGRDEAVSIGSNFFKEGCKEISVDDHDIVIRADRILYLVIVEAIDQYMRVHSNATR